MATFTATLSLKTSTKYLHKNSFYKNHKTQKELEQKLELPGIMLMIKVRNSFCEKFFFSNIQG